MHHPDRRYRAVYRPRASRVLPAPPARHRGDPPPFVASGRRPAAVRLLLMVAVMGAIFLLSSRSKVPRLPGLTAEMTAIAGHFTAYGLLAAAVWTALAVVQRGAYRRLGLAFAVTMAYGVSDELHQLFVDGRTAGLADLAVDAAGAASLLIIIWHRHRAVATSGHGR